MTAHRPRSWSQLMASGFETKAYAFENLPTGERNIVLEESVWHPKLSGIIWFFLDLDSNQRYRISVFRNRKRDGYGPEGFDLAEVPVGEQLAIDIHQNATGTYRIQALKKAETSTSSFA